MSHLQSVYGDVVNMSPQVYNEIFGVALNDSERTFVDCVQWWTVAIDFDENMGRTRIHKGLVHRAGEPEPERGAMEPANFGGAGTGAGAFLNISAEPEPELEPQKFY